MSKLECKGFTVQYFGYSPAISSVTTVFSSGLNVIYAAEKGGKTTFLKAIAGILPYKGELLLDGEDFSSIPLKQRDVQMLFDDYALFSRHSARSNLEYPLRLRKVPKEERRKRVEEAAALFDLDVMIDAPVYKLNEWHKLSIVLCRAYLREAKVLLIDNVFSGLDPLSRKEALLRYLPMLTGKGIVIYATDLPSEAAALSKEIKLLSYGYLLQEGAPEDFLSRPACVAAFDAFAEYASFLPCSLTEAGLGILDKTFPIGEISLLSEGYLGGNAIVGLLPEDLILSDDGFSAEVVGKFYRGAEKIYSLRTEDGEIFLSSERELVLGEQVKVAVTRISGLFDAVNERTIVRC